MKCFVSGRSSNIDEISRVMNVLRENGHQITEDWTVLPMIKPYGENQKQAGEFAVSQINGISESDVYIVLAHHDGTGLLQK